MNMKEFIIQYSILGDSLRYEERVRAPSQAEAQTRIKRSATRDGKPSSVTIVRVKEV